jgi:hypothetical protein
MSATITFDQLESNAENSLAWVLWAKNVKNVAVAAVMMALVNKVLGSFLSSLTADRLNVLSHEQAKEFRAKLQQIHAPLVLLLNHRGCGVLKSNLLFRSSIEGLEESAEDLSDIIEDLVLADNPQFNKLVHDCVQALSHESVGLVGRM